MSNSHDVLVYSVSKTKLIELVKNHPCIYDSSKSSSTVQKQAWKTISGQLLLPDYVCREEWRKLRKGYSYSIKNNKKFAFDELLEFLRPHLDFVVKQPEQKNSSSFSDLMEDLKATCSEQECPSAPKKTKTNDSKNGELGAQYLANSVINDTGSTTTGPIRDFMIILSLTMEDLTEEQLRKFKRRAFVLLNDIVDEI